MAVYLDYNASHPVRPEVIAVVKKAMQTPGNASAPHGHGRAASKLVEDGREAVAQLMGVCAQDLIFTGSGTESLNTAIGSAIKSGCKKLYISSMDHPASILMAEQNGADVVMIPALASGLLDINWLMAALAEHDKGKYGRPFISIAIANSETGVVQEIEKAVDIARDHDALLLLDAVQALGKIPLNVAALADYVAVSAHKIGGPQGVGALYVAAGAPFHSLLIGGGQEKRRRAGTLNVAGIAGFGMAAKLAGSLEHTRPMRDKIEAGLIKMEKSLYIFGKEAPRLPNTSFFAVPDKSAQTLMMALDIAGVSVSTGLACSSGKVGSSRAITAMGLPDKAPKGAIRISLGSGSTQEDVDIFLQAWSKIRRHTYEGAA